jgi:hypothetical protein
MKILKDIEKSPFKKPNRNTYLGRIKYGVPYFYPSGFNPNIITIKKLNLTSKEDLDNMRNDFIRRANRFKNRPRFNGGFVRTFKIFGNYYYINIGSPIKIKSTELGWKDKFNSPRFEFEPTFNIFFFFWQYRISYLASSDMDTYWEMYLWWKYYSNEDIVKAEKTWKWRDGITKESTWNKNMLKDLAEERNKKLKKLGI